MSSSTNNGSSNSSTLASLAGTNKGSIDNRPKRLAASTNLSAQLGGMTLSSTTGSDSPTSDSEVLFMKSSKDSKAT
ncbi:hypothetical protein EHS25_002018 [Saitozyma podzolica]|uniref:Uncharacterized protein n=1 Tax=Saitozyma podzolica TaxID=1890683 RepID=A0A427YE76_9TREE|nr:hypothetical protein EHS25_002018 [Saitozyma podzolica]